jgi:phage gpG-like protein
MSNLVMGTYDITSSAALQVLSTANLTAALDLKATGGSAAQLNIENTSGTGGTDALAAVRVHSQSGSVLLQSAMADAKAVWLRNMHGNGGITLDSPSAGITLNAQGSGGVTLKGASLTLEGNANATTWPTTAGADGDVLTHNGAGAATWLPTSSLPTSSDDDWADIGAVNNAGIFNWVGKLTRSGKRVVCNFMVQTKNGVTFDTDEIASLRPEKPEFFHSVPIHGGQMSMPCSTYNRTTKEFTWRWCTVEAGIFKLQGWPNLFNPGAVIDLWLNVSWLAA